MKYTNPPKWASFFLKTFVSEELYEEISGDILEAYNSRIKSGSKLRADLHYILDVFRFFKPYSFEKYSRSKQYLPMFKNYVLIAGRNIVKRKSFTAINLSGLTLSLAVILLISLFIEYHLSYDTHYPKSDRTYRLENAYRSQIYAPFRFDEYFDSDRSSQLKSIFFLKSFSEIEDVAYLLQSDAAISQQDKYAINIKGKEHIIDLVLFTNTPIGFQNIFPQTFILGSEKNIRNGFNKVLLTKSTAKGLYGDDWDNPDILGKIFIMEVPGIENSNYTISGIIEDPQPNSHFSFKMITITPRIPSWGAYTYFTTTNSKSDKYLESIINQRYKELEPEYGKDERYKGARIQNIKNIHLSSEDILYELRARINPDLLGIFFIVAIVVFIITLSNYINLSIAMYTQRQKEIGMRKVLGAQVNDIVFQLMTEIILIALIAIPLATYLVFVILPIYNSLLDIEIQSSQIFTFRCLGLAFGITIITGVLSGIFPALIFGKKSPMALFKVRLNQSHGKYGFGLRRTLIGAQFVLLILMLSLTGYIYSQMDYVRNRDLGFSKSGVLNVPIDGIEAHKIFKQKLLKMPVIERVGNGVMPGLNPFNMTTYLLEGEEDIFDDANIIYLDMEAMRALEIEHPAFSELDNGKDQIHLINQALAIKLSKSYNMSMDDLIGKAIIDEPEWTDPETGQVGIKREIHGILPDMHFFSLKFKINPLIFVVDRESSWAFNTVIRLKQEGNYFEIISDIEDAYYSSGNTKPFELSFLSDNIDKLYKAEQRTFWLITTLSIISIGLALIGLVGLVSFMVETRKREIGIRKIFGASIYQILFLINREFLILTVISTLLAGPFIYILTEQWLQNFAYRININPLLIVVMGLLCTFTVSIVVFIQSRKITLSNPKDILTEE